MTVKEAIKVRTSVRQYKDTPIEEELRVLLDAYTESINRESGLHIQIHYDELCGFDAKLAQYGKFENVNNYIVVAGKERADFDEACGYYGEKLVLYAQTLGLNTCWVGLTYNKKLLKEILPDGEKLCIVIALGYGVEPGVQHKSKTLDKLMATKGIMPEWFREGAEAAMLAPTALNQQKFKMGIKNGEPVIKVSSPGFYTKVDLGIVKYHFEIASGRQVKLG